MEIEKLKVTLEDHYNIRACILKITKKQNNRDLRKTNNLHFFADSFVYV